MSPVKPDRADDFTIAEPPGRRRIPAQPARELRGYSKKFTPRDGVGKNYLLKAAPPELWAAALRKATRDGFSMRTLILQLLTEYVNTK